MPFEIITVISADQSQFFAFWSQKYFDKQEPRYSNNIGRPLNEERVKALFEWKNGTSRISKRKLLSIKTAYLSQLAKLPTLKSLDDGKIYLSKLQGGIIWNIFWLHCLNQALFPIFDQNVYRAMASIEGFSDEEMPRGDAQKVAAYFDTYVPFTKRFVGVDQRTLDRALFTYGKFCKSRDKEAMTKPNQSALGTH